MHTTMLSNSYDLILIALPLMLSIWPFGRRKKRVDMEEEKPESAFDASPTENWAVAINLALLGRFTDALRRFQAMVQENPQNPALHYNIGLAHLEMGEFRTAVESFQRATELAPERPDAYANLGVSLHQLRRLDEACEAYRQALQLKPDEADYYYNWGTALMAKTDPTAAVEMLGHAYNSKPNDPEYCFNFAFSLAKVERHEDARRVFESFLKLSRGRDPKREDWIRNYLGA